MSEEPQNQWTAVDRYITETLVLSDPALDAALEASSAGGLPTIQVSPSQGKFLHLLARMQGARTILEIGTLGGYSTIWLARALPSGGRLITLEVDPHHADVANANIARAGLADVVELRMGRALDTLPLIASSQERDGGPFDLIFIDADKPSNPDYFTWALKLSRLGSLIIIDNVIRDGEVIDASSDDPNVQGVRRLNELLAAERRVSATTIQTVGSKGYDGFTMALVIA
jgi:predicted O-methyltransferase YrrM